MQTSIFKPSDFLLNIYFLLFSVGSLSAAFVAEYGFNLLPCELCLLQRIPLYIVVVLTLIGIVLGDRFRRAILYLCLLSILAGAAIAVYHVGVEMHLYENAIGCADSMSDANLTVEEMTKQLMEKPPIACDKPAFVFLGISMAGWNAVISSIFVIFVFKNLRGNTKNATSKAKKA